MIDLSGPSRPWPARLQARFATCQEESLRTPSWWITPAPYGEPRLLERLAELFGSPAGRTIVTGGVRQFATSWAVHAKGVVVEAPTFSDLPEILGASGPVRTVSWSELTGDRLAGDTPGTIWVTSPCRNPDGASLDAAQTDALAKLAGLGHEVVINQVYRWFGPAAPAPIGAWTVTSLAKVAGGGVRLGWATAPADEAITRSLTSVGPPTAWQRAWAAFLTGQTVRALWAECVEPTLDARRAFTGRVAELLGWDLPGGGPFLLLDCDGMSEAAGLALLTGHGLKVSPGSAFLSSIPSVRLAFSGTTVPEAAVAAETIARLGHGFRPRRAA